MRHPERTASGFEPEPVRADGIRLALDHPSAIDQAIAAELDVNGSGSIQPDGFGYEPAIQLSCKWPEQLLASKGQATRAEQTQLRLRTCRLVM